jgi:hypothetical protein
VVVEEEVIQLLRHKQILLQIILKMEKRERRNI